MNNIRVIVVDDQALVRDGIASLLALQDGIDVVGTAENGREGLFAFKEHRPDVVLMDIRMPVMDGITATGRIRGDNPDAKILMLTTFDDEEYIVKSLRAGAVGYLMKDLPIQDLASAVKLAANGTYQMDAGVMGTLVERISDSPEEKQNDETDNVDRKVWESFTDRERDVLRHLARGDTNREIAGAVNLSEGTVKNYVSDILAAMGLRDRTRLALRAHKNGWDR